MGFVSGFTGGVTLTLGVAYLSVLAHERNRSSQALYLRSQSQLLTSIHDSEPQLLPISRAEIARASRSNFTETAKDRWNEEVGNAVRRVQTTDWNYVREGAEGAIARLLGQGLEQSREGIENAKSKVGARVVETMDELSLATKGKVDQLAAHAQPGPEVEKSQDRMGRSTSQLTSTSSTDDGAREIAKNAFSNSIEKGKELLGRVQAVVEPSTKRIESEAEERMESMSAVDKALKDRYEKLHGLDKTVEEALEERYRSVGQKF